MIFAFLLLACQGVDEAVLENRYRDAISILRKEISSTTSRAQADEILRRVSEVRLLEAEYRKVRKYDGKVDPKSSAMVGRFECFVKGAWERGLPLLAKGDSLFLSTLAKKEISGGPPLEIADSWWSGVTDISVSGGITGATGSTKERIGKKEALLWESKMKERALFYYERAWPTLIGKDRERVRGYALRAAGVPDLSRGVRPLGDPRGWNLISDGLWGASWVAAPVLSGRKAMRLVPSPKENDTGFAAIQSLQVRAIEKQKYTATVWVFSSETDVAGIVEVRFFTADGTPIQGGFSGFPPDHPFWVKVTVECEAPAGSRSVVIDVRAKLEAGNVWIDDASIVGPEGECLKNGSFEK